MIDEQINWLFHENITFGNIFVESESLNMFTVVICMPVRWKVSNNSVSMSPFSDDVNIYKYSDVQQILRFALLIQFLWDQSTTIALNCLNRIFLMILKPEQAQRRIFFNTFMLKINITFNLSLACLQNEDHGQKRKCSTRPQFWGTL